MKRFFQWDWLLLFPAGVVLGIGLLTLYGFSDASTPIMSTFFFRQGIFAFIGIAALVFFARLDYRHLGRHSTKLYFFMMGVLALVLLIGTTVHGTSGWIAFGGFNAQPVEFAKIVLVIFLASFISQKKSELGEWTRLIASVVLSVVLIVLVLKQPDLGSALVLAAIWLGMTLVSGIRLSHMFVLVFLGVTLIIGSWFFLEGYQKARIETFLHPELDPRGSGYNVLQAMVAVGSGGLTGKGVGHGSQSQLNFLPEKHTDFIFAVVVEDLGLLGAGIVLSGYLFLFYRVKRIADEARDNFGYLVAVGFLIMFFIQTFVNVGMNIGILPVTGIPAPFLSYGGSSLLSSFIAIGIMLNIWYNRRQTVPMTVSLDPYGNM